MPRPGRIGVASSGAVLLAVLTACSGGADTPPKSQPSKSSDTTSVSISNPKDATAVPLCELLTPEEAQSLGYEPQGKVEQGGLEKDSPKVCEWDDPEVGAAQLHLGPAPRKIADYYAHPETWSDFGKLTISGHPAVRANRGDPMKSGNCGIYLATQNDQMLVAQVSLLNTEVGKKDPCQVAKKALEAAVPDLPPAK